MTSQRVANVVIQPAVLYILTALAIPSLNALRPWRLPDFPWLREAGLFLFFLAWVVWLWGALTLRAAGTNILPIHPSLVLVSSGPFRYSRNPLYLALALTLFGLCLIFHTAWGFLLFLPYQGVLHFGVVLREEQYLASIFGKPYLDYCGRVRRWL